MSRVTCLFGLLVLGTAFAAPVPKEQPDPLPDGAIMRLGSARFRGRHTDGVVFSKDGKTLYATDEKATVYRWDAVTGKPLATIKLDAKGAASSRVRGDRAFVASPNNPEEPSGSSTVRVFDLPGGIQVSEVDAGTPVDFHVVATSFWDTAISADGTRFAVSRPKGGLTVFDADTGKPLDLPADTHDGHLHFSADGRYLLVDNLSNAVVIDLTDKKLLAELPSGLRVAEFSPDSKTLVGQWSERVSEKGEPLRLKDRLGLWDVTTGKERSTPTVDGPVWHLGFVSADAVVIGHRSEKGGAVLSRWDAKAGKRVWTTPVGFDATQQGLYMLTVSPDGSRVVVTDRDGRMGLFDAAIGKRLDDDSAHTGGVRWVALSADGKTATTVSDREIREWDAITGKMRSNVRPAEVSQAQVAGACGGLLVWFERDYEKETTELIAWDRAKGKMSWRAKVELPLVRRVQTSEAVVVVVGAKEAGPFNQVRVFDAAGKEKGGWETATNLGFAPTGVGDASVYLGRAAARAVSVRAMKDGTENGTCGVPQSVATDGLALIAPSSDEKLLVLGSAAGAWAVVDSITGKVQWEGRSGEWIAQSASVAADGKKVILQTMHDPVVRVFELKEDGKVWTLDGKGAAAAAVAFSPDGKKAVIGYRDGTVLIWDVSK